MSIKVKILTVLASGFKAISRMDTNFQSQKKIMRNESSCNYQDLQMSDKDFKKSEKIYRLSQRFGNIHQSVLLYSILLSTNQISKSFLEDWVLSLLKPSLEQ